MSFTLLIVIVHVLAAFATVAGLIGRTIASAQLAQAQALTTFLALSELTGRFEMMLVRPASLILAVSGILLAFLEGYPMLGSLQGGQVNWLFVSNLLVLSIVGLIVFVFLPRDRVYAQALEESKARGEITPALRATFSDPILVWGHRWENIALVLVIVLMIAKPL